MKPTSRERASGTVRSNSGQILSGRAAGATNREGRVALPTRICWYEARTEFEALTGQTRAPKISTCSLRVRGVPRSAGRRNLRHSRALGSADARHGTANGSIFSRRNIAARSAEPEMLDAVNQLAARYPPATIGPKRPFFRQGTTIGVNLDRDHAASYYQRASEFAAEKNAPVAAWRPTLGGLP